LTLAKTYAEAEAAVRIVQEEMRAKVLAKQQGGVWRIVHHARVSIRWAASALPEIGPILDFQLP
jgi:hypothetical protein